MSRSRLFGTRRLLRWSRIRIVSASATAYVSINARTVRGYNAVTFLLGFSDALGPGPGDHSPTGPSVDLVVTRDGKPYTTVKTAVGRAAQRVTILFGGHTVITFTSKRTDSSGELSVLLLAEPTAIMSSTPSPPPPLFATPVAVRGGQQTVTLQTKPHAFVSMVVTYPSGKPLVVGPLTATATGRFAYSFIVPHDTIDGPVSVVIVAGGAVIQGSFGIISLPRDLAT